MKPETKRRIEGWFYKSEPDYFSSFATLWIAFNAFYKDYLPGRGDHETVSNIGGDKKLFALFRKLQESDSALRDNLKELAQELKDSPLTNMKYRRTHELPYDGGVDFSFCCYKELIEIIYQIRNNMIHGDKDPESQRDEKLVRLAYKILHSFMAELINNDFQLPEADGGR